ncbi:SPOR domain-containing protein [Lacibacter sp. H407]|uniref:SPOR domain-containing protein n=1 Tax=Lacibacter sp. H407 TaxID=3133423 RepID=UPI0030C2631F
MKIQDILSQYLYKEKSLTLPGLGRFDLDPSVNVYELKEEGWPSNTISFTPNRNAPLNDELLQFLVQQTGKMKPLAMSDLESYISSGLQLLNIGKPFPIKGIGSLTKTRDDHFQFEQGSPALEKIDSINTDHVRDRTIVADGETAIDFSHEERKSSKKPILMVGSLVALVLVGFGVYLAIQKFKTTAQEPVVSEQEVAMDTIAPAVDTASTPLDTAQVAAVDTTVVTPPPAPVQNTVNSGSFQLIVDQFKAKAAADRRVEALKIRGFDVSVNQKDSSTYRVVLQVNRPLADSAVVMDSLRKFYLWKPKLIN